MPLPSPPSEGDWRRAAELLRTVRNPVLACHVGPDGDALGSMLAVLVALRAAGVEAVGSWGEAELTVPVAYSSLAGQEFLVPPDQVPAEPELLITFDSGSADRLGLLADRVKATLAGGGEVVVLDHHPSNTAFGSIHLVEPTAAATAVLAERLLVEAGLPLTAPVAEALYVGLVTDTGSFRYAATTPDVHDLAGRLLATGIDHAEINRRIWDSNPFSYLPVLGAALSRVRLEPAEVGGLGLVWTWLGDDDLTSAGLGLDAVEGVIDVIRSADEAEVAVICKQGPDSDWRVSMRSKGRIDVGLVGTSLGGGGHRFAAGFSSCEPVASVLQQVREALAGAEHLTR